MRLTSTFTARAPRKRVVGVHPQVPST